MKPYWFNKRCCVPECFNSSTEGEGCYKEFFDLPAEPQSRSRWLKAIFSGDGEDLKICEDHFKDDDVFRDKNHRKKLRLNSIPSVKLPENICAVCLGSTRTPKPSEGFELKTKMCQCIPTVASTVPQALPEKRMRVTWTSDEKRTLFRAIKKHGDVKLVNNHVRINWGSVFNYCRDNGCFGNEKELKNVWQYLRIRAGKVYKNEVYGTKLERKVSRFLYGKGPKLHRMRPSGAGNDLNSSELPVHMEAETSDDEFNESQIVPTSMEEEEEEQEESVTDNNNEEQEAHEKCTTEIHDKEEDKKFEHINNAAVVKDEDDTENETYSGSDDEYYSIEDIESKLGIRIASTVSETYFYHFNKIFLYLYCGCRKFGISCSMFCKECMGLNCGNADVPEVTEEDVQNDVDKDIDIQFENIME